MTRFRTLATGLAVALSAALLAPSAADATVRHHVVRHPHHLLAATHGHHRLGRHATRLARASGADTVRVYRARQHVSPLASRGGAPQG